MAKLTPKFTQEQRVMNTLVGLLGSVKQAVTIFEKKYGYVLTRKEIDSIARCNGVSHNISKKSKDLYFIQCQETKRIKVGISDNPESRLFAMQTGSPTKLVLLAVVSYAGQEVEEQLHRKYRDYRVHGEWFEENELIIKDLENMRDIEGRGVYYYGYA